MHANVGDWLIAQGRNDHSHARRAEILAVHPGGVPPFTVRWLDDGHKAIVFPGPDARVITPAELADLDRVQNQRISAAQSEIAQRQS